ncbi:hypothetical protein [Novosphingobium sp. AP12]|uniref:hypothetical protein n=1 Tax=Novosphingobium sp. AP12 TaxID=1144305 RepID=UPI000271F1E9|nr:hypothetical protein [Novosphingobium sp. AP12]EJL21510.1 hypothetical protein PMI02_05029 [Novosphingobium sp. AP12]
MDRISDHAAHQSALSSSSAQPAAPQTGALGSVQPGTLPSFPGRRSAMIDWRRKMSDHIAYALLVYTALQIFVTVGALKSSGGSLLPYFALVMLVVAIIPACRRFESRWNRLTDEQAHDPALARYYKRDRLALWALAIGLPFALTALFKGLAIAFA